MSDARDMDWYLILRYALLIGLTMLIPIPVVDGALENLLRRRLVRSLAEQRGIQLTDAQVATLGNATGGGCMGCLWGAISWPFRKILRTVLIVLQVKVIADLASEIIHRSLLLEEALKLGLLPDESERVREVMDRSLASVDTRVVERRLLGVFRAHTSDLNRAIFEATRSVRAQRNRGKALAEAIEADSLGSGVRSLTSAMEASLHDLGVVPELVAWFRAELGAPPLPEANDASSPAPEGAGPQTNGDPQPVQGASGVDPANGDDAQSPEGES